MIDTDLKSRKPAEVASTKVAVRLDGITKRFGPVVAVDRLSLHVHKGEVVTLLGPSGCGKTTTLRLIAGLESPDQGELFVGPRCVVSVQRGTFVPAHKRNMGMVFQSYAIWPHMTVFDNVAYPLKVRRVSPGSIKERVLRTLELVGLSGLEQRPAPRLSGGQQQRVALARALVHEPNILLLDEPFSNLDAKLREQMRVQLKLLLNQLAITAIFVTHDQTEALILSDRIVVMNSGHVEQIGASQALYEHPASPFVRDFLGQVVLLPGTVMEARPAQDVVVVQVYAGGELEAPWPSSFEPRVGAPVSLAIRPEDVTIWRDTGGTQLNCLAAVAEAAMFVGDHHDCRVKVGGALSFSLFAPRHAPLRAGEAIRLELPAQALSLWPR